MLKVKVREFRFSKLTNAGHLGFHSEVQLFLDTCGVKNISCVSERPLYDAAILAEVAVVKRQRSSSLTADLEILDKDRDGLVSFILATSSAAKHSPIDAAREANKQLLPVVKPYQGIPSHTHVQESGEIIGLLKDLREAHLAVHITALNLTPAMDMLEVKNNAYMQLDKQRISEMPSKVETDTLRKNVDGLYLEIVDKVNATVVLSPNDAAITLVDNLNNYIQQMNASYNLRMGHTKKDDLTTEVDA